MLSTSDFLTTLVQIATGLIAITGGFTASKLISLAEIRSTLGAKERDLFRKWERLGQTPKQREANKEPRDELFAEIDDIRTERSYHKDEADLTYILLVPILLLLIVVCVLFPLLWLIEGIEIADWVKAMLAAVFSAGLILTVLFLVRTGSSIYD